MWDDCEGETANSFGSLNFIYLLFIPSLPLIILNLPVKLNISDKYNLK